MNESSMLLIGASLFAMVPGVVGAELPLHLPIAGAPSTCLAMATGTVTFQGSGVLGKRTGHQEGAGVYFACRTTDPTIHSGSATFESDLSLDCSTLQVTDIGTYTIRWDNGQSSVIDYEVSHSLGTVAFAVGRVASGEFAGQSSVDYDVLFPLDPRICTEESGSIPGGGFGLLELHPTAGD